MLFDVLRGIISAIPGRDPENPSARWHKVEMVRATTVQAATAEDAIEAAKAAGVSAPIVQPARH